MVNGISQLEREIPKNLTNVEVRLRDNVCFDLGSYGQMLGEDERALVKKYKKFILLNSSVRGPFLPVWSRDCWSDIYTDMITDTVKLGGMTFNCPGHHVHSMIYSTDQAGLNVILDGCFSKCFTKMHDAVRCEIQTTWNMVDKGHKFDVLMTGWHGEYEDPDEYYDACSGPHHIVEDVNVNDGYFGFNVHPYETLFVKSNRNIQPKLMEKFEEWHDRMNYSSWDVCGKRKALGLGP